MRKYYVEIVNDNDHDSNYIMQSKYFETEEQATEWFYYTIDFIDKNYFGCLMYVDDNDDIFMERFL